jgi:hypothetical protein
MGWTFSDKRLMGAGVLCAFMSSEDSQGLTERHKCLVPSIDLSLSLICDYHYVSSFQRYPNYGLMMFLLGLLSKTKQLELWMGPLPLKYTQNYYYLVRYDDHQHSLLNALVHL